MLCFRSLCLTLTLSAQLAVSFPQTTMPQDPIFDSTGCKMCPAGEYRKSCTECEACPAGSFTTVLNWEHRCSRCSTDCSPKFHLKVIRNCTNKSDLTCVCEEGYTCVDKVPFSANCRFCNKMNSPLPPTLLCVFGVGCMALLVLVYIKRHQNGACFKKAMALLICYKVGRKASHKSKESSHHFPSDCFSAKQQLPPLFSGNLGPVHVHNPGTIIFSLLSQFTGQVGPTTEGENKAQMETGDERGCPVVQPASSPNIHTSEEERSQETDSIFFPFQEQGKDCHVSKEEVLSRISEPSEI